jgi:hypothetical protein
MGQTSTPWRRSSAEQELEPRAVPRGAGVEVPALGCGGGGRGSKKRAALPLENRRMASTHTHGSPLPQKTG